MCEPRQPPQTSLRPQVVENPVATSEQTKLEAALARVGKTLGEREVSHVAGLEAARAKADEICAIVTQALAAYHAAIEEAGRDLVNSTLPLSLTTHGAN